MQCEMCGAEENLFRAEIEGVEMTVCKNCSKFGKVISAVSHEVETKAVKKERKPAVVKPEKEIIQLIVDNYPEIIKKKREAIGLKQKELAKKIAEKESVVHNVEAGRFEPGIGLARKLEKFLKIKLVEEHEEDKKILLEKGENGELTIGDFVKVRKR